jgi:hypothetical protein
VNRPILDGNVLFTAAHNPDGKATFLFDEWKAKRLTGDLKHFGPYMIRPEKPGGIIVQTVADFLASL